MDAAEHLRRNELDASLAKLLDQVRSEPANAKFRVFLFQLACVMGDWTRAKTQLEVAISLDDGALLMGRIYGEAIAAEAERRKVFAGECPPAIFGKPQAWMAELCEALRLDCRGDFKAAAALRERAFDAAPASAGRIDGKLCAWIADADSRLGPMLEVIINGRYYWLPFLHLTRLTIAPPTDLRDQVWMPATIGLTNGGEAVALIPTRYPGSDQNAEPLIRLARKTAWTEIGADVFQGSGQRILATDEGEFPLMDIRSIELDEVATEEQGAPHG
jgi:type VI secretion system protein ImpE